MPKQPDLFAKPKTRKRKAPGKPAPERLTPPEMRRLHEWAERVCPWIRREALDSFDSIESHVEEILEYWQGRGDLRPEWLKTIQNRIRTVERDRLKRMAKDGHDGARQALLDPSGWAKAYDARRRATSEAKQQFGEGGLIEPAGGRVIRLDKKRGDGA